MDKCCCGAVYEVLTKGISVYAEDNYGFSIQKMFFLHFFSIELLNRKVTYGVQIDFVNC